MSDKKRGFVARRKQHQTDFNRLLKHVALSPNRAVLVKMVTLILDAETEETRRYFMGLTAAVFMDPRGYRWKDPEDDPGVEVPTKADTEAKDKITAALAFLKEG